MKTKEKIEYNHLSNTQIKVLRALLDKGKITRVLEEDGYKYTWEDWEQNENYLYPSTFHVLNENHLIEKYLSPTPYCDFYCISAIGIGYLEQITN